MEARDTNRPEALGVFERSDLDLFLSMGKGSDVAVRRLLGIVEGTPIDAVHELESFLRDHLHIDFHELCNDREKLAAVAARFFHTPTEIEGVSWYFDRQLEEYKDNVAIVRCRNDRGEHTCYLKYCDEGPRREALAMRLNNLLTDQPVPFMASGYTMFQLGVPGYHIDIGQDVMHLDQEKVAFALGKADAYVSLLGLGDRKPENLLIAPNTNVSNIDFGAAFSEPDRLSRYVSPVHADAFEHGRQKARSIVLQRAARHRLIVTALLDQVKGAEFEQMKTENVRGTYPVQKHPREWINAFLLDA